MESHTRSGESHSKGNGSNGNGQGQRESSFKKTNTWRHRDKGDGENNKKEHKYKQSLAVKSTNIKQHWRRERGETSNNRKREHSPRKQYPRGFKYVEGLLENNDLEKMIGILINDKKGFRALLESKQQNDTIVLLVKLLCKICNSSFVTSKSHLLQIALSSDFIDNLTTFILHLPLQNERDKRSNNYFWKDPNEFWNNLIILCKHINELIPFTSCQARLKVLKACMLVMEDIRSINISEEIKGDIKILYDAVNKVSLEVENKHASNEINDLDSEELEPPDDYRKIDIYPSASEVTTYETPFLRPNIIKGPYKSVEHYLDIQFRLLREDFITPLKDGICKYLKDPNKRLENIRIYHSVRFLAMEMVNDLECYRIQFNSGRRRNINYENSKRFMYGSLLCLTSTHFESIFFGKIVGRDIKDLKKGHLIIGFDEMFEVPRNIYEQNFLMVESSVYFEPYYHVLKALQNMRQSNFPMERYILKVETESRPPEYLKNDVLYTIEDNIFQPLNWGENFFYDLNDAQHSAFKAALTQEFCIIQGPPGTGKTFLGLKIAHTLIHNKSVWYNKSPMLVICYTNHALDQFLEGLLVETRDILRIGSRSKNEKLNQFNIMRQRRYTPSFHALKIEVKSYIQQVATIDDTLKQIELNNSIMDFAEFSKIIPNYEKSWFKRAKITDIQSWLLKTTPLFRYEEKYSAQNNKEGYYNNANSGKYDEEIDDIWEDIIHKPYKSLIGIENFTQVINLLNDNLQTLRSREKEIKPLYFMMQEEEIIARLHQSHRYLKRLEEQLRYHAYNNTSNNDPPDVDVINPLKIPWHSRWELYWYWLDQYKVQLANQRKGLIKRFRGIYRLYSEAQEMESASIMKNSLVVGMTTTGAARLQSTLQALKSPIVIIEEAAEILEAHIISSLTKYCKHLILIGDHQQLKPSSATYRIETKYRLGISLFERMVMNKIQCYTLNIQHRMRPEISCLIHPSIYPTLEDHESVLNKTPIGGVLRSVYFINHQEPEEVCEEESKRNVHEATFLIKLAKYIVLNGYEPKDIIILVAYLGQMYEVTHQKTNEILLQDVRIAVLDNYQGEESEIVLLSLVRSNDENKIGFLKIENRVCVALSRAKNGFYMMGNMNLLCANSDIWPKVKDTLEKQNAIGPHLTLQCQVHNDQLTPVSSPDDFMNIPEGGCALLCNTLMTCGHICKSMCHIMDRDHSVYKCREKCTRLLCENEFHVCQKLCYEECGPCTYPVEHVLGCDHTVTIYCSIDPTEYKCIVLVKAILPCDHEVEKKCHIKPEFVLCPFPCDIQVDSCGHACARNCHVNHDPDHLEYKCSKPCVKSKIGCSLVGSSDKQHTCSKLCSEECEDCIIPVKKHRTVCSHVHKVPCNQNVDEIQCEKPCTKTLLCGHKCKKQCYKPCGTNCQIQVEKVIPGCQHKMKVSCSEEPNRKICKGNCPLLLPCGHQCDKKCSQECTPCCEVIVDCLIPSPCGHVIKNIACGFKNTAVPPETLLKYCTEKCNTELKCGHKCSGNCGECSQGRIHLRCKERCGIPLICNHECNVPCRQACKPCEKMCQYRCAHSKCRRKCGDPCMKCIEPCRRRCEHKKCKKLCGDICDIPPCYKPCQKKLKCSHACVGFCGDPCPKLCRVCNKKELTEIFLGNEDKENATYVMLADCQHIFESEDLEQWLTVDNNKVMRRVCPRCSTAITRTERYSESVKTCINDIQSIKLKSQGTPKENDNKRIALLQECKNTMKKALKLYEAEQSIQQPIVSRMHMSHRRDLGRKRKSVGSSQSTDGYITPYEQECPDSAGIRNALHTLAARLHLSKAVGKQKRRQPINIMDIESIKSKLTIIDMIINLYHEQDVKILSSDKSIRQVVFVLKTVMRDEDRITAQEVEDTTLEIERLSRIIQFEKIQKSDQFKYTKTKKDIQLIVQRVTELLDTPNRYSKQSDATLKVELLELNKLVASAVRITEVERREIVGALNMSKGHWFKCPNGHFYVIGECGGANQISKCNECGVQIGGTSHNLLPGQSHAPEMDGSLFPAWSEAANLANYNINAQF